ncbi:hypothetical protein D3C86_1569280 [compost metagenome]
MPDLYVKKGIFVLKAAGPSQQVVVISTFIPSAEDHQRNGYIFLLMPCFIWALGISGLCSGRIYGIRHATVL